MPHVQSLVSFSLCKEAESHFFINNMIPIVQWVMLWARSISIGKHTILNRPAASLPRFLYICQVSLFTKYFYQPLVCLWTESKITCTNREHSRCHKWTQFKVTCRPAVAHSCNSRSASRSQPYFLELNKAFKKNLQAYPRSHVCHCYCMYELQ